MTRMLACVTGPEEAAAAIAAGADIIDVMAPAQGVPGAAPPVLIRAVVMAVAGRRPVSAAAGDPAMPPDALAAAAEAVAACGVAYVRIGLSAEGDAAACIARLAGLVVRTKLIAVLFADAAPPLSLLPALAQAGFAGAMLDTLDKSAGRLLGQCDITALRRFVAACRAAPLLAGLAGGLETPDIPRLLLLAPDLLGFRQALCGAGGRTAALEAGRVRMVRRLIPPDPPPAPARHPPAASGAADRVLVEDLVLPAFIGAYAHERGAPQRVRFAVIVCLRPAAGPALGMEDVFSYDLITDGIRLLLDGGHFAFVETLAERIAAMLLAHPRVDKVTVRVEKLDAGPARVGVEIERTGGIGPGP